VLEQMNTLDFDVLPVDEYAPAFWVRAALFAPWEGTEPRRLLLGPADLVAANTPIPHLLRLMANGHRAFFFVLGAARVSGLITYADLNRLPVRTAVYALVMNSKRRSGQPSSTPTLMMANGKHGSKRVTVSR
jgi:hypothetical protein